jgi:hypothetical protein
MWDILSVLTVALAGGALIQYSRLQAWKDVAASCGLEVVKVSSSKLLLRLQLEARAGPVTVRIENSSGDTGYSLRVLAAFPRAPGLFSSLKIRRRHGPGALGAAYDLEVGDELFDRRFCVEGSTRLMAALLDEETRRLLLGVEFEGEMEITGSEIRLDTFGRNLRDLLPVLLALIRRLTEHGDVVQRLAHNARQDPAAGVRLRNLLALIRELPGDARTLEALRTACADPSPRIRLRAARELGAERRDVLFELAENLEDDAVSAEAVSFLGRGAAGARLPCKRTQSILVEALHRRCLRSARACLEALGQSGDDAAVDALARVLALEQGELAPAAALALGATGSPTAEPPLLLALQREEANLRVAAATALGRVGSVDAVLPLQQAAEGSPGDRELHQAARQAIAEIQSRLLGASPGQLALAATEAGQLSLAQETGQLSLDQTELPLLPHPEDEPEQPSGSGRDSAREKVV